MLEYLNFDCLKEIFQMLNLEAQKQTRYSSEAFADTIELLWRRLYKKINLSDMYDANVNYLRYADESEYLDFMSVISGTLEHLCLEQRFPNQNLDWNAENFDEQEWLQRLSCLREHSFTKVKTFECMLEDDLTNEIDFGKMFPALTRLELYYNGSTKCGDKLAKSLETITCCNLLEELYLHSDLLEPIMDKVFQMPNLRKICVLQANGSALNVSALTKIANSSMGARLHALAMNFGSAQWETQNVKNAVESVLSLSNLRNCCTLASKAEYDLAFADGTLQAALATKSFDYDGFINDTCNSGDRSEKFLRYRRNEIGTLNGNSCFQSHNFWNREYAQSVALYCQLNPVTDSEKE